MPLPGKLCIGILEEDNPQKSYFRFKPLLVEENGLYVPFEEHSLYAEDGCIRIVPDKNESSHFKARMRRMGLFAVVDLREHPNDNDKIRPNKNYHGDDVERNANIIYSDVVREPAADMIFAVLTHAPEEAEGMALSAAPGTNRILLRPEETLLSTPLVCEPDDAQPELYRLHTEAAEVKTDAMQLFTLPGFGDKELTFAILPPNEVAEVTLTPPARPIRQSEPAPVTEPVKAERIADAVAPAETPNPVTVSAAPVPEASAESDTDAPETGEPKPWIVHDKLFDPRPLPAALNPYQRMIAMQCGLNPRRGRNLQEIVDDKWRHSRIDQLGHSIADISTDAPALSPTDYAVGAVRAVWDQPEERHVLLSALAEMDSFDSALDARRVAMHESAVNEQLNELEAQRLKLLDDLEQLKRLGKDVREELKNEIRVDEAKAFADAVKKAEEAQAAQRSEQEKLDKLRSASDAAQDALNALVDGRFEQRLNEFAINSRAAELLRRLDSGKSEPLHIDGTDADAEALVRRVTASFAAAGQPIDRNDAIHLLICAAQSPVLLFSGAPGSGKTSAVRLLARALGVDESAYAEYAPGQKSLDEETLPESSVCSIVLLDDANLAASADMTRGLTPTAEQGQITLCLTLQDDGMPVPAHLFGRAFTLRFSDAAASDTWKPAQPTEFEPQLPVSRESLKNAFAPKLTELPESVSKRMEKLRADLAIIGVRLSRRTLSAMWNYCAAAIPMTVASPLAVLDRVIAEHALPAILAGAPLKALAALPKLVEDLPRCKALLSEPLPVQY